MRDTNKDVFDPSFWPLSDNYSFCLSFIGLQLLTDRIVGGAVVIYYGILALCLLYNKG